MKNSTKIRKSVPWNSHTKSLKENGCTTLLELQFRWKAEGHRVMKRYASVIVGRAPLSVEDLKQIYNKPRGRAVKVANKLILNDVRQEEVNRHNKRMKRANNLFPHE